MQEILKTLTRAINEWIPEQRPVSQAPPAAELEQSLDLSLTTRGCNTAELESAVRDYLHYNPDVSQPGFYKLLYSGRNKAALLGDWITSLSNATMHTYQMGPVATLMELELIRQLNRLTGFEEGEGTMVSGGSQANTIGMMLARHRVCPDFKTRGAEGRTLVAFVSDQAHYSARSAANVLGIGTDNLIAVASDDQGRLIPSALQNAIEACINEGKQPFYIGLTAGTTVTGAFDPVTECSQIARDYSLWLHIDGAWGAPVLFSSSHRQLLRGSHLADSFSWDAHKLMNVPVTAAVILVRHRGLLKDCCSVGGDEYLFHSDENAAFNLGERSLQCGRRADALKVWLSWKACGHQGYADKIDYLQSLRQQCTQMIDRRQSLQMLAPAAYLNVLFRYRPTSPASEKEIRQLNIDICKTLMREGEAFVDYARYKGRTGIRLILANPDADANQLTSFLDACERTGRKLESSSTTGGIEKKTATR